MEKARCGESLSPCTVGNKSRTVLLFLTDAFETVQQDHSKNELKKRLSFGDCKIFSL